MKVERKNTFLYEGSYICMCCGSLEGNDHGSPCVRNVDAQLARDIEAARGVKPVDTGVDALLDERGKRYGRFMDHAVITLRLKEALQNHAPRGEKSPRWSRLSSDQREALDMICHKLGRIINGDADYADSWIDISGYAKLVADRLEGIER